jgi:hypothetical protein
VTYLRLTPAEYRYLCHVCRRLDVTHCRRPVFRRRLAEGLADSSPDLRNKVALLGRAELRLLHEHFREPARRLASRSLHGLTRGEWGVFIAACETYPLPVRFVRAFRHTLADLLREVSPGLARKLRRLSGRQFERLYEWARKPRA